MSIEDIKSKIRDIPDFPKKGIIFKDISPLLADSSVFYDACSRMCMGLQFDTKVVGLEARGFLFGIQVAFLYNSGFVMVRKPGKLPGQLHSLSYKTEYSFDTLCIQQDAIKPGDKVLIVDDVLATGGTALATYNLLTAQGAQVTGFSFLIEIADLKGRELLKETGSPIQSVIQYGEANV